MFVNSRIIFCPYTLYYELGRQVISRSISVDDEVCTLDIKRVITRPYHDLYPGVYEDHSFLLTKDKDVSFVLIVCDRRN